MGQLQMLFDKTIKSTFSNEYLVVLYVEDALKRRGARFTARSRARLREDVRKFVRGESGSFKLPPGVAKHIVLTPAEQASGSLELDWQTDDLKPLWQQRLSEITKASIADVSKSVLKLIDKQRQRVRVHNDKVRHGFEVRLRKRWGAALATFDVLRDLSLESGEAAQQEYLDIIHLRESKRLGVLLRLHARACHVAAEVSVLLRAGLADGAHARWRTLHEIAVVSLFLQTHGEEVAERYLMHQCVEARKGARGYQSKAARLGMKPLSDEEMAAIEDEYKYVLYKYGKEFDGDYGWATVALANPRPNFSQIEEAVELDHTRPYYRMASDNIHATPRGAFHRLGLLDDRPLLLAGPSNAGLLEPLHGAAISLSLATTALLFLDINVDRLVAVEVLRLLLDRLAGQAHAAREKLLQDESKLTAEEKRRAHARRPPTRRGK